MPPPIFYFPPIFTSPYFSIYTLNKTSSLKRGRRPKWREKLESASGGPEPKTGGEVAPNFTSRFGGG